MRRSTVYGLLLLLVIVGCGGRRKPYVQPSIYSMPVQDGQKIGSARYPFPGGFEAGRMEVYFQGLGVRKVSGYPQKSLRIQVSCDNHASEGLVFDTTESHLIDNRGDVLRCSGAWRDGARAESFEEVRPASHAQFDLFFDIKPRYPLEKLDSFRVYWRYRVGEQVVSENTTFIEYPLKNVLYKDEHGHTKSYKYFIALREAPLGKGAVK